MKRETISRGIGDIDARYIQEAAACIAKREGRRRNDGLENVRRGFQRTKPGRSLAAGIAAVLALCALVWGIMAVAPAPGGTVTVYAQGTEITAAGAVIDTGTISDNGVMTGAPLMFCLVGENIATVRFSCKNQVLNFTDWTEKREDCHGQNFTVVYGEEESEYSSLSVAWWPLPAIRELTGNRDSAIVALPEEMRRDVIVMEITFGNGKTATKAVTVSLQDDGTFFAALDAYTVSEADAFVRRPDAPIVDRRPDSPETLENIRKYHEAKQAAKAADGSEGAAEGVGGTAAPEQEEGLAEETRPVEEQIEEAKQAALDYYSHTVFTVNSLEYTEKMIPAYGQLPGDIRFNVNVSRAGVVQEPDRSIILRFADGRWKVVNEGY